MAQVKNGDAVQVHYTGRLPDGTVFDSSRDREPLRVQIGAGQVIAGFERGLVGMAVGDSRTITLPPDDAYGYRRDDLVVDVKAEQFPEHIKPEIGQQLQLRQEDGSVVDVRITRIEGEQVTLDANHPLAGETLVFEIEVVGIE